MSEELAHIKELVEVLDSRVSWLEDKLAMVLESLNETELDQ